jgi:hypothetical protein|tara:strand:- start:1470 stop:1646 length:177 start_codon:yes stop_codon:yes gene_type:complete
MNDSMLSKVKVLKTITTINGTLYEGEIVKIVRSENGNYRLKDSTGKIWYVKKELIGDV